LDDKHQEENNSVSSDDSERPDQRGLTPLKQTSPNKQSQFRPKVETIRIAEVVISASKVMIWPFVIVFVLMYFGADLKSLLQRSNIKSIKVAGTEITLGDRQAEAIQYLGAATAFRLRDTIVGTQGGQSNKVPVLPNVTQTANVVKSTVTSTSLSQYAGKRILWVDDQPDNNLYEIQLFQSLGMVIDTSTSTDAALEQLSRNKYDVVITDMLRSNDSKAGYELLESIHQKGIGVPLIIYSRSSNATFRAEAIRRGALGETNDPTELFKLVTYAVLKKS